MILVADRQHEIAGSANRQTADCRARGREIGSVQNVTRCAGELHERCLIPLLRWLLLAVAGTLLLITDVAQLPLGPLHASGQMYSMVELELSRVR